jgi:hypothetical protein
MRRRAFLCIPQTLTDKEPAIAAKKNELEYLDEGTEERASLQAKIDELEAEADAMFEELQSDWIRLDDGLKDEESAQEKKIEHLQDLIIAKKDEL